MEQGNKSKPESVERVLEWLNFVLEALHWGSHSRRRRVLFGVASLALYVVLVFVVQSCMLWVSKKEMDRFGVEISSRGALLDLYRTQDLLEMCVHQVNSGSRQGGETCAAARKQFLDASHVGRLAEGGDAEGGNPYFMLAQVRHEIRASRGRIEYPELPQLSVHAYVADHWLLLVGSLLLLTLIVASWAVMMVIEHRSLRASSARKPVSQ